MDNPVIIQGGMGAAVSSWGLARAVSMMGQLGVVSGTALPGIFARCLQMGDLDGKFRHALRHFPIPGMVERILDDYFVPGGRPVSEPMKLSAMPALRHSASFTELAVASSFAEVFLAKEGHNGVIGINLLEKIQLMTLVTLFGAMLAGVDYVLMGAGIPRAIPGVLDRFAKGEAASLKVDVEGALAGEEFLSEFDPMSFCGGSVGQLKRPKFLGIVSSATLAMTLARKASGRVDGFVVEGQTAGGHNAPPRGPMHLTAAGEPLYGPRDVPELDKIRAIGLPFWMAGSYGRPGKLNEVFKIGGAGIQVGTAFAFCEESGLDPALKKQAIALSRAGKLRVFTDPRASSTGYPFKVVQLEGTLSEERVYRERSRICDLGYLRHLYRKEDGTIGYRCPSEPVEGYVCKGGVVEDTIGRKCICNALPANVGLGYARSGGKREPALVTAGDDVADIAKFLPPGRDSYTAADVVARLLSGTAAPGRSPA